MGFALAHPAVSNIGETALGADGWVGVLHPDPFVGNWLDLGLLLVFGGIPWQVQVFNTVQEPLAVALEKHKH